MVGETQEITFEVKSVDNALEGAPIIYVDGAQSILSSEGIVKFNLTQDLLVSGLPGGPPVEPIHRVICARLVMTPQVFIRISEWMNAYSKQLQAPEAGQ